MAMGCESLEGAWGDGGAGKLLGTGAGEMIGAAGSAWTGAAGEDGDCDFGAAFGA